ncbi:hypothetical protein [Listeria booriae]|uniref:Uncharacterized protein n=1 Tax=Listeria booriae TaxID=1552123 RepID=A0A7X1A967_9LIST|nr:hypothetical protein [Listeria booriae]MBC1228785.1 hypothetical protein [Listeria booriae]MBC1333435.1 hypothetical protein [Listeria booriae]MBC2373604.1 hypothetical protein [Listeria booriae]MBC2388741.1 hypothetical protein [Listeria booriae]
MTQSRYIVLLEKNLAEKIYADDPRFDHLAGRIESGELNEVNAKDGVSVYEISQEQADFHSEVYFPDAEYRDGTLRLAGQALFCSQDEDGRICRMDSKQEELIDGITYLQNPMLQNQCNANVAAVVYLCGNSFKNDFLAEDKSGQKEQNGLYLDADWKQLSVKNMDLTVFLSKMYLSHDRLFPEECLDILQANFDSTDWPKPVYVDSASLVSCEDWQADMGFNAHEIAMYNSAEEFEEDIKVIGLHDFVHMNFCGESISDLMVSASEIWQARENESENWQEFSR